MALSRGARRLHRLIKNFQDRYGPDGCFASQERLAKVLNTSVRSVQRWTAALICEGYIEQRRRSQETAVYNVLKSVEIYPKVAGQVAGQVAGLYKVDLSITSDTKAERKPPQSEGIPDPEYTRRFVEAARRHLVNIDTPEGRPLIATAFQARSGPEEGWSILRGLITQPRFAGRPAQYLAAAYRGELAARNGTSGALQRDASCGK